MGFWSGNDKDNVKTSALDKPSVIDSEEKSGDSTDMSALSPNMSLNKIGLEKFGKVRSALSEGTVIQGKLSFDTPVRIDGKLSGEVYSTSALIVGENGEVDAEVQAESLIILGQVKGTVQVSGRIELLEGGKLDGDVKTPVMVVQENTTFNGKCSMGKTPEKIQVKSTDVNKKREEAPVAAKQEEKPASEEPAKEQSVAPRTEARVH